MEPGLMRYIVTVQKIGTGENEFGEPENQWADVVSLRASISPVSGREFAEGFKEHSQLTHKVTIRYNKAVKPHMRLKLGDRIFDILHIIDPWEMHQEMTLMCRELVT